MPWPASATSTMSWRFFFASSTRISARRLATVGMSALRFWAARGGQDADGEATLVLQLLGQLLGIVLGVVQLAELDRIVAAHSHDQGILLALRRLGQARGHQRRFGIGAGLLELRQFVPQHLS